MLTKAQYLVRLQESVQLSNREKGPHIYKSDSADDLSPFRSLPNELLSRIFVLCSEFNIRVFYRRYRIPHQITISQVCSRWRQVALGTGALWSSIEVTRFDTEYTRRLSLYQMLIGRAGDYPLTVSLYAYSSRLDIYKVFLDFVVPFRIKKLDITMYHKLSDLPSLLNVEEFAISNLKDEDLNSSAFMDKTRHISIWHFAEECEPKLKQACLSWHRLRSFECDSGAVPLSTWLDVLRQGTLQYLEQLWLTISNIGTGPLVGVCIPNLRWLSLSLLNMQPSIIIPLIAAPNITTLEISSYHNNWSSDTYDIIKRHYKLHQLHHIRLCNKGFPLCIAQILADAPIIHTLEVLGKPILDTGSREGIASGRIGSCLTTLNIGNCFDTAGEWLDMIERRQKNVKLMAIEVSNWREMFTGVKLVGLWNVPSGSEEYYKERVVALEALGTTVVFAP